MRATMQGMSTVIRYSGQTQLRLLADDGETSAVHDDQDDSFYKHSTRVGSERLNETRHDKFDRDSSPI